MIKPDYIPQDIWDKSRSALLSHHVRVVFAHSIMEARTNKGGCDFIADNYKHEIRREAEDYALEEAEMITAANRKRSEQ